MQRSDEGEHALHRNLGVRLFSGFWLQPFFTMALLLDIALQVFVAQFESAGELVVGIAAAVPLLALWLPSLLAYARVDGDGVRWRCFRTHVQPWTDIERVRLGALFVKGSASAYRPTIMIAYGGREVSVMPTYGCTRKWLYGFAEALCTQAIAHGKPVYVDSPQWAGVPMLEGMQQGPPPGPKLERSPIPVSVQVRLFVLVLPVIGVLGLLGGITGWDTTGTGERIAVGIVGGVFLLLGVPIVFVIFVGAKRSASAPRLAGPDGMR